MIKIFAKKEINDKEFFARITEKPDVSGTVKEIIETGQQSFAIRFPFLPIEG